MKLSYTRRASLQVATILAHMVEQSPQGARRLTERILEIEALLRQHPLSGRATTISGVRRIAIIPFPYLVNYRYTGAEIIIQRVRHAARRPLGC